MLSVEALMGQNNLVDSEKKLFEYQKTLVVMAFFTNVYPSSLQW